MELFKKIAKLVAGSVMGKEADPERPGKPREELAREIGGSNLPVFAKRQALAKIGYSLRKFSRRDVAAVARAALGAGARYTEQPEPVKIGEPQTFLGVVEAPGYFRMVNRFERYAPGEGRRRMVSNLLNPDKIKEMQK